MSFLISLGFGANRLWFGQELLAGIIEEINFEAHSSSSSWCEQLREILFLVALAGVPRTRKGAKKKRKVWKYGEKIGTHRWLLSVAHRDSQFFHTQWSTDLGNDRIGGGGVFNINFAFHRGGVFLGDSAKRDNPRSTLLE